MIELLSGRIAPVSAPPLAPIERPIDLEHLSRMTLGDRSLEREVLQLFERQATMMLTRMEEGPAAAAAAAAHTLMGSARGIGAWSLAKAAERVEAVALAGAQIAPALAELKSALAEVRIVIADLLRAHALI
ncbi:MAG TPA: Hpt domain-containing protein [Pseudorhodoplanes sp.]|jgi:HPt (histidine-containing phosphotransfer) domain-containing protein|nr:Hpt domain-containing protein [Pseudorhodoplanes sp.]